VLTELAPDVPAVACFDTSFHATLPPAAATYAIPQEWRDSYGIRKYGFHGLAHAWTSRRAVELLGPRSGPTRIVTCHLGAGASLAAVVDGRCVDTTMGFTPLDGLVMATRAGAVDPGLVLWLQVHAGIGPDEIGEALEERSGLTGLAGTPDMRVVLDRAAAGDDDASLALDVYLRRLRTGIAAMAGAAEGLDAIVFSGGVGEHAPEVRCRAVGGLGFLGVTIDVDCNRSAVPDADIRLRTCSRVRRRSPRGSPDGARRPRDARRRLTFGYGVGRASIWSMSAWCCSSARTKAAFCEWSSCASRT